MARRGDARRAIPPSSPSWDEAIRGGHCLGHATSGVIFVHTKLQGIILRSTLLARKSPQKIKGPLPRERPEVDYGAYSVNGEGLADCSAGSSHHEYGYSARAAKGAEGPLSLPGTKSTAIPVRLRKQLEPSSLPGLRAQNENLRPRSAPRRLALKCYPSPCERCFTPAEIYVKRSGLWTAVEAVNFSSAARARLGCLVGRELLHAGDDFFRVDHPSVLKRRREGNRGNVGARDADDGAVEILEGFLRDDG